MAKPNGSSFVAAASVLLMLLLMVARADALMPFNRPLWDAMMLPGEDPFRILEQLPLDVPKGTESLALARADWKETAAEHVISIDIPGMKKEDLKIEVEDNRVLRITGERKTEQEVEGQKWHRAERTVGKFWRQFRLPMNADMDHVSARLEDGVLRITVPKLAEEKMKHAKVISIAGSGSTGEDVKATTKTEL